MDTIDRILSVVLDTQADIKDLQKRMVRLEDAHEKVYNKLDGFLVLI